MADLATGEGVRPEDPPVVTATGVRVFLVNAVGPRRLPMAQAPATPETLLLGPILGEPFRPGWQKAECEACVPVAPEDHGCGWAFWPTFDHAVRAMAPSPFQNRVDWRFVVLSGWSIAFAAIETRGPWRADSDYGAYRCAEARVRELYVSPTARTSAADLSASYGVPAHQGVGPVDEWLMGLVPWGSAALDAHRFEADAEVNLTRQAVTAKVTAKTDDVMAKSHEVLVRGGWCPYAPTS